MKCLALLLISGALFGQSAPPTVSAPPYEMPASVSGRLSVGWRALIGGVVGFRRSC